MAKIRLVGYQKTPIEIAVLEVNVETEGYVWLRMLDKDGKKYETGMLKETAMLKEYP